MHDIRNQRYAFSQGRSYKSSTGSYAPYSGSEPSDSDGESEMEWEGWMRDLERQGSVKQQQQQQHPDKSLHSHSGSEHQLSGAPISLPILPSPPLSDASSRGYSPPHSPSAYPTIGNVIQNRDAFSGSSLDSRIKTTTVSTVSVGTASSPSRRRSSTLTPGSLSRLMKDRDRDRDRHGGDVPRPLTATTIGSRTHTLPRGTHIRHAHSGSNLRLSPMEHVVSYRAQDAADVSSGGKKKVGIVREMSMRAEKLVRGLDPAIDFVDNHKHL